MTFRPQWYDADTDTLASAETITIDAGDTETARLYDLWNDKAGVYADTETIGSPRLRAEVWDGSAWVSSGEPPLDNQWLEVSVTGSNRNDSTMAEQITGWVALGTGSELVLSDIPKNCAREISVRFRPIASASGAYEIRLAVIGDENSQGLASKVGTTHGILRDYLIEGMRRIRTGLALAVGSSTADINVATGSLTFDGQVVTVGSATDITLNQSDSAAAALASGESYKAVISVSSAGVSTATKGTKGTSPAAPATPSGGVYLGTVTVRYQAGGTTILLSSDIDTTGVVKGEYLVEDDTGLDVTVNAGQAIHFTDRLSYHGAASTVTVADDDTSYIWILPNGTFTSTLTDSAPSQGAEKLADVLAASGDITSVTDARSFIS